MGKKCPQCQRTNPNYAGYCYFDGGQLEAATTTGVNTSDTTPPAAAQAAAVQSPISRAPAQWTLEGGPKLLITLGTSAGVVTPTVLFPGVILAGSQRLS